MRFTITAKPCKGDPTMSQSLAKHNIHLGFSTKDRRMLLRDKERGELHSYHYRRFCEKNGVPVDERYVWD